MDFEISTGASVECTDAHLGTLEKIFVDKDTCKLNNLAGAYISAYISGYLVAGEAHVTHSGHQDVPANRDEQSTQRVRDHEGYCFPTAL